MKRYMLWIAAALVAIVSQSANAQLTSSPLDPGVYNPLRSLVAANPGYSVDLRNDRLAYFSTSGREGMATIEYMGSNDILLSGDVARFSRLSGAPLRVVQSRIMSYNMRSSVGSLWYDEPSGTIRLTHHLNPGFVSPQAIARVAATFSDRLREQRAAFAATRT